MVGAGTGLSAPLCSTWTVGNPKATASLAVRHPGGHGRGQRATVLLTVGRASPLLCILPAAQSTLSGCSPGLPHLQLPHLQLPHLQLPLLLTGVSESAQRLSPFPHQHSPHSRGKGYGLNWGTVASGRLKYFVLLLLLLVVVFVCVFKILWIERPSVELHL